MRIHPILATVQIFVFVSLVSLQAQQALPSAGTTIVNGGGSVSLSVGQPFYSTYTRNDGSLTQGVQQAVIISITTDEDADRHISCSLYPNPANNFLAIKLSGLGEVCPEAQLFDLTGTLVMSKKLESPQTIIPITLLTPAVYTLIISENGKRVKSFQLIKK